MTNAMMTRPLLRSGRSRQPDFPPDIRLLFEEYGVDALRGLLITSADGQSGTARSTKINVGVIPVARGDIQDWLNQKDNREAAWRRLGTVAAVVAAVFSVIAVFK